MLGLAGRPVAAAAAHVIPTRNRIRDVLAAGGGVPARGRVQSRVGRPVANPFAASRIVEGDTMEPVPVGAPEPPPAGAGFLDGIQRWVVEGHFGVTPVVRAYVAAAVLVREGGVLRGALRDKEEFLAVPLARLSPGQRSALEASGLSVHDTEADARPHPLLDVQAAGELVERRREVLERRVAAAFLTASGGPMVVDGGIGRLAEEDGADRLIGLIKSHETQFLEGAALEAALTLPPGARSRVFARTQGRKHLVHTWYLRLWPWTDEDLLHGLVRVERRPGPDTAAEAGTLSRWLLGERAPIAGVDARWDRLIYPMHEVETYLRAHAGGWE